MTNNHTKQSFQQLILKDREEALRLYFLASVNRWLEDGPEEIVRVLTYWATRADDPSIKMSDEVLLEAAEGRVYDYGQE